MDDLRVKVRFFMFCFIAVLLIGCDNSGANEDDILVDIQALFASPSAGELATIQENWAGRDVSVQDVEVLAEETINVIGLPESRVQIVSHTVTGLSHVGAIMVPTGAAEGSLPVLVYNHFGDEGIDLDATFSLISLGLTGISSNFVLVAPAFRSEVLSFNGQDYMAEGPESPWDFDVDDSIALLNVALETVPEADPSRIITLGVSRGGGVSLLMAARDPRIDAVVEYFGPTDFFVSSAQQTTQEALRGEVRDLPGLDFLNQTYLFPLQEGTRTLEEVRLEYIRRSPVYFVNDLPLVQVHHGNQDDIVPVDHATSLLTALNQSDKGPTDYEVYLYPNAGHDFFQMPESFGRAIVLFNTVLGSDAM